MKKYDKPKLWNTPIIAILSTILGILAIYGFFNNLDDELKLLISAGIIGVLIVINLIRYRLQVNELYSAYEERIINHEALGQQFIEKNKELVERRELNNTLQLALYNSYNLMFCLLNAKNDDEREKIKNEQMANVITDMGIIKLISGGKK